MTGRVRKSDGSAAELQADANGNLKVSLGSGAIPAGATMVNVSSANGAAAQITATMPAVAGQTNYITGFEITAGGATAAAVVDATVAGLLGGTATYVYGAPAGAGVPATPLVVTFNPPIPASAANVAIVVTLPSLGAGNTKARINLRGFLL